MAYFDWNATTPMLPEARAAWLDIVDNCWGNASTPYRMGAQAKVMLDEARESIAAQLGVGTGQVVFTSGATEGNNGFIREAARRFPSGEIWISAIEHPSVREAARYFWGESRVILMPVLEDGTLDLQWLNDRLISYPPALLSLMAVNNETGVIQPFREVAELCYKRSIPFHCDAVQWAGKDSQPCEIWSRCSGVTLSAHKFGGPKGTGCLVLGEDWGGIRLQAGGAQELDSRAGTEDVAGIVAMATALKHRLETPIDESQESLRNRFEKELMAQWPDAVIHGKSATRVGTTSSISLPDHRAQRWIARLDKRGFNISTGSACSAGKQGPSVVLQAMGVGDEAARRTVRISAGWETSGQDWEALLAALIEVREELDESGSADGPGTVIQI